MRIRTLLNKCQNLKSFVYQKEYLEDKNGQEVLIIQIIPRKNSKPICSCCGKRNTIYDHQGERDFEFVPLWGFKVFFRYRIRRVKVEQIPWAKTKNTLTNTYAQFLAHWANKLSWLEITRSFKTSWYHIFQGVKQVNESINKVRIQEVSKLKKEGFEPVLAKSKYCFLKREENLTEKQNIRLKDLLKMDLQSVKAYLYKQSFELFWQYKSPYWANLYLEKWRHSVMHSNLDPMKTFVKTLRNHQLLLMNWFKAKKVYSSGIVEGLNRKVNLVTRKSYGFRSYDILKIALFHTMGNLPEPKTTHSFF